MTTNNNLKKGELYFIREETCVQGRNFNKEKTDLTFPQYRPVLILNQKDSGEYIIVSDGIGVGSVDPSQLMNGDEMIKEALKWRTKI